MNETCHTMNHVEILNVDKADYPLFHAVLYGDKVSTEITRAFEAFVSEK